MNFKEARTVVNCVYLVPPREECERPHCMMGECEGDCHIYLEKSSICSHRKTMCEEKNGGLV